MITDIPSRLPAIMADPVIVERVLANLLSNALRHSPPGSPPLLSARAHGDRVKLRVVDHGPGIPEADRGRVFLAEAMGATVEPEGTPGGGLTMVVSLPAAPARPAAAIGAARRTRAA